MDQDAQEIFDAAVCGALREIGTIRLKPLLEMYRSGSLEAMVYTIDILLDSELNSRVSPSISNGEFCQLYLDYFERLFVEDPEELEGFEGRTLMARSAAGIFMNFLDKLGPGSREVLEFRKSLERLIGAEVPISDVKSKKFLTGGASDCLVKNFLGLVFRNPEAKAVFDEWKKVPNLKLVYENAVWYAKYGIRGPW